MLTEITCRDSAPSHQFVHGPRHDHLPSTSKSGDPASNVHSEACDVTISSDLDLAGVCTRPQLQVERGDTPDKRQRCTDCIDRTRENQKMTVAELLDEVTAASRGLK